MEKQKSTWHEPGTCGECRWWEREHTTWGDCRGGAPAYVEGGDGAWPTTDEGSWCGEWSPLRSPYEVWEDGKPTGKFRKDHGDRAGRGEEPK